LLINYFALDEEEAEKGDEAMTSTEITICCAFEL
jgi:hypothetical protein